MGSLPVHSSIAPHSPDGLSEASEQCTIGLLLYRATTKVSVTLFSLTFALVGRIDGEAGGIGEMFLFVMVVYV